MEMPWAEWLIKERERNQKLRKALLNAAQYVDLARILAQFMKEQGTKDMDADISGAERCLKEIWETLAEC